MNIISGKKGAVRAFIEREGKEINTWFGFENTILGTINPYCFSLPSMEHIQFLEESSFYTIAKDAMSELFQLSPEIHAAFRVSLENFCKILENRSISLQALSATERYHELIKQNPNILQRVSLGHIASYLGITQETLSRIRRK